MSELSTHDEPATRGATTARLIAAWMLVGAPLAWGVWQVLKKSLDLFR